MRNNIISLFKTSLSLLLLFTLIGCSTTTTNSNTTTTNKPTTLTVYTYDSLAADYGLLPLIVDQFELDNNVNIEIVNFTDTGAMLNQLIAEKTAPKADVVLGLDNINFIEAKSNDLLEAYQPKQAAKLDSTLLFDDKFTMTPFDYGYVGFVYDTTKLQFNEPISLATLISDPAYKDKIILEQPGLSSPGTQLLIWLHSVYNETTNPTADKVINNLSEQALTVAPDWNTAYYTMFINGEAPIVLSYLTSPAYHIDQENSSQYAAIPISEGYLRQVEGVAMVKGTDATTTAQTFIDYLLTDDVQNQIPRTQWMWPVLGDKTTLPEAYQQIITPTTEQAIISDQITITDNYQNWLNTWNTIFGTL